MLEQKTRKELLVGVAVLALVVFGMILFTRQHVTPETSQPDDGAIKTDVPTRTDFGTSIPPDFPTDIPVEKGTSIEQSYLLEYAEQEQLTTVFLSTKSVKENYTLYAGLLEKQKWSIVNKYESPTLSSLYGTKEGSDINITVSDHSVGPTTGSEVSISVVKK
jgi:hypothetical protein